MDYQDGDDYFDTNLDALPQSTLQYLETSAISSTQQQTAARRLKQYNEAIKPFKLSVPGNGWQQPVPSRTMAQHVPGPPSSDYGLDDEDVIDLDEPEIDYRNINVAQQRNANGWNNDDALQADVQPGGENGDGRSFDVIDYNTSDVPGDRGDAHNLANLKARINELERERANLQQAKQDADAAALKKAGEIAIVRAKQEKDAKEFERRISVMQQLHADEAAKNRADLLAAKKHQEAVETNNRFLEHDLAQELERTKRLKANTTATGNRAPQTKATNQNPTSRTPEKSQSLAFRGLRDGFDDHEILVSPSKPKDKPKPDTPKAGEKRKRMTTQPSPARPLNLAGSRSATPVIVADLDDLSLREQAVPTGALHSSQLQIIKHVLKHRFFSEQERSLEVLTRHAFPSMPNKSIANLTLDELSSLPTEMSESDFCQRICNFLLDLWLRCLDEDYYTSLYLIADLLELVIILASTPSKMSIVDRFVPIATKTIDLIALPRARIPETIEETPKIKPSAETLKLKAEIDVNQILGLLHSLAMNASLDVETKRNFWHRMEFDFTLMMLNKEQELPQILLVLQMVGSSVLASSFGVLSPDPQRQSICETGTIDRLTCVLFEKPVAPEDQAPYEDPEFASLYIEAIRALSAISLTRYGSIALAQNKFVIGRLVRFLHLQVSRLHELPLVDLRMAGEELVPTEPSSVQELTATLINLTTRLLYHLLHNHGDLINLREKLHEIPGGHHKFLTSLTRLAFSEQLVFEVGIDEETVDAAHEILDSVLTPEEGDAVVEAIETPRGTTGTRASAPS